jgi:hypothetical protein
VGTPFGASSPLFFAGGNCYSENYFHEKLSQSVVIQKKFLPLHRIIAIKYLINKKHIQDEKGNSSRELSFSGIQGYVE